MISSKNVADDPLRQMLLSIENSIKNAKKNA